MENQMEQQQAEQQLDNKPEQPVEQKAEEANPTKARYEALLHHGATAAENGKVVYAVNVVSANRSVLGDFFFVKRRDAESFINYLAKGNPDMSVLVMRGKKINTRVESRVRL